MNHKVTINSDIALFKVELIRLKTDMGTIPTYVYVLAENIRDAYNKTLSNIEKEQWYNITEIREIARKVIM